MREQRVVVGTDGSPSSQIAAVWAAREAQRRRWSILLVHADTPFVIGGPYEVTAIPTLEDYATGAKDLLSHEADRLREQFPGLEVETRFTVGRPVHALIGVSANCELLVVGAHGHSQAAKLVLGSVATNVAAHAHCPVVVVRGHDRPVGPVVVGVDGSPGAKHAMSFAFGTAASRTVPLRVVICYQDDFVYGYGVWRAPPGLLDQLMEVAAATLDDSLTGWHEKYPDVVVETSVVLGHPVPTLLRESMSVGLLVVGSRGRGEFAGLLLGSVGKALIRDAGCPVAVLR